MPCDSIITQSVALDKITDWGLLGTALEGLGVVGLQSWADVKRAAFWFEGVSYSIANGQLSGRGASQVEVGKLADHIKQGYSKAAVYASAKKNNWLVKEVSKNKFEITRRF